MKINKDSIQIDDGQEIFWDHVKTLKEKEEALFLILTSGMVIEIPGQRQTTIDAAFRAYESYLKDHPHQKRPSL